MSDTVVAAIVGAVAGIITGSIGSLFAPWANWGIEKRKQKLTYRRELVSKWRTMLEEAAKQELERDDTKLLGFLEKHKDFYSLTNHIPNDKDLYAAYRTRHASVNTPVFLRYLSDEIARIEKEWDLV